MALGAAVFVTAPPEAGSPVADLTRLIQGAATGIGFVGAGAILKLAERGEVGGGGRQLLAYSGVPTRKYCDMEMNGKAGFADGIRADEDGNIWVGAGWVGDGYDGVHIFAPDGARIGLIRMPEIISNVCFGGSMRNRLFMTGSQSLYAVYVETVGAHIT